MLKTLLKSVRQYKKASILSPILVFIEAGIEMLVPFLIAKIIDQGISKGNMQVVLSWGTLLLIISIIALIAGASASWISSHAAAGFAGNLRHDLFYHVQTFSFANIDQFSPSGLVTRLTTDITNLQQAYQVSIRVAFRAPFLLLFSMIMAFIVSPQMAMIFVVVIPVLAIGLWLILISARKLLGKVFHEYDRMNQVVGENVRGIRVVKTYVREKTEISKFNTVAQAIYRTFSKAQRIMALNAPLMQFVVAITTLALSWFGARLVVDRQLQVGQLVSLFAYTVSILTSLMMLSNIFTMLTLAETSGHRVVNVLTTAAGITNPVDPVMKVPNGDIEFNQVDFSYKQDPTKLQLKNINLKIPTGKLVGIIGETGSGKSSLVQLIPRLYDVTSGAVKVGGVDVRQYDLKTLRDNVAMVLQNNVLFSGTIKDNLRWGNPDATDEQMIAAAKIAQADGFIQNFPEKYDTHIDQNGNNVSGGQRQRIALARALLKNPQILILDDATSATDTETDAKIREGLKTTLPNTTKLVITQRIVSLKDADEIIVMADGQIQDIGTHDELMQRNSGYRDIYLTQTKGATPNEK